MYIKFSRHRLATLILLATTGVCTHANESLVEKSLSVGSGPGFAPEYQGAKDFLGGPTPIVNARWGRFHVDEGFLVDLIKSTSGDVAIGVGYDFGRRDVKGKWHEIAGSDYLKGMGQIEGAPTVNLIAHKIVGVLPFGVVQVNAGVTQWIADSKFTLAKTGISLAMPMSERITIETAINYTWGNQAYMQSYFGVSALQASNTQFKQYNLSAGSKDISASIQFNYMIMPRLTIMTNITGVELLREARLSPIVQRQRNANGHLVVMYKIR